jgi:hypothetical protein
VSGTTSLPSQLTRGIISDFSQTGAPCAGRELFRLQPLEANASKRRPVRLSTTKNQQKRAHHRIQLQQDAPSLRCRECAAGHRYSGNGRNNCISVFPSLLHQVTHESAFGLTDATGKTHDGAITSSLSSSSPPPPPPPLPPPPLPSPPPSSLFSPRQRRHHTGAPTSQNPPARVRLRAPHWHLRLEQRAHLLCERRHVSHCCPMTLVREFMNRFQMHRRPGWYQASCPGCCWLCSVCFC